MNQREQFVTVYRLAGKSLEAALREADGVFGAPSSGVQVRALGEALCRQFAEWCAWHEAGGVGTETFAFRLANPRVPELSVFAYLTLSDERCALDLWMPHEGMGEVVRCAQNLFWEGDASETTEALGLTIRDLEAFRALNELRVAGPARRGFASIDTVWAKRAFRIAAAYVPASL